VPTSASEEPQPVHLPVAIIATIFDLQLQCSFTLKGFVAVFCVPCITHGHILPPINCRWGNSAIGVVSAIENMPVVEVEGAARRTTVPSMCVQAVSAASAFFDGTVMTYSCYVAQSSPVVLTD
jgi:hypothetical protein